jgi:hypothetical protein
MTVDLLECGRCGLLWVEDPMPERCPRCMRRRFLPTPIVVAQRDVTVKTLREFGVRRGLGDPLVRDAVQNLDLSFCPHGFLTASICSTCRSLDKVQP